MRYLLIIGLFSSCAAATAFAQSDPLNSAYLPSMDTNCAHAQYNANAWLTDGMTKLFQGSGTNPGSACTLTIYATQNEFADFQVHFHDSGSGTAGLKITANNFVQASPSSSTISAATGTTPSILVYREAYMTVSTKSATPYAGTPAAYVTWLGTGNIPDILIPAVDPYRGQTTNAWPFTVAASNNQSAWIDIHVPPSAPSGYYLGSVVVQTGCPGSCTTIATMPITLGVWQWPSAQGSKMPSTSSLPSTLITGFADFCNETYGSTYGNCAVYPGATTQETGETLSIIDTSVLMLDHRYTLNIPLNAGAGVPPTTSFTAFETYYTPLLNGTTANVPGMLSGAKWTSNNFQYYPTTMTNIQNYATEYNSKGWFSTFFNYGVDEPGGSSTKWSSILTAGATLHGTTPPVPQLVTSDLDDATACGGNSGCLNVVDTMTVLLNQMDGCNTGTTGYCQYSSLQRSNYSTWLSGSSAGITRKLWSYIDCESAACGVGNSNTYNVNWPNYQVDGTPVANRAMEWMTFYHQQTGELYFNSTTCWEQSCGSSDPWTAVNFGGVNGDGTLIYPGRQTGSPVGTGGSGQIGITVPIILPSLRLKYIRDGMQDYEYLNALTVAGQGAYVTTQIQSWITSAVAFNNVPGTGLELARSALGTTLHQITFSGSSANVSNSVVSGATLKGATIH